MPTVGRTRCSTPCTTTGRAAPSRMRLAMRRASVSEWTSAHTTTNLSLATRATMSVLRRATDSRLGDLAGPPARPLPRRTAGSRPATRRAPRTAPPGRSRPAGHPPSALSSWSSTRARFGGSAKTSSSRRRRPRGRRRRRAGASTGGGGGRCRLGLRVISSMTRPRRWFSTASARCVEGVAHGLHEGLGNEGLDEQPVEMCRRPPARCRARPGR